MKTQKTATLLILLVFSVCGYTQNTEITKVPKDPTSKDSITFFGKIKSVTETTYQAVEKFGEVAKGKKYSTTVFKCDNKKNLVEYEYYGSYEAHDDVGNYVGSIEYKNKTIIKYDDAGKKIEKKTYTDEQLDSTITWKYNDKGYVIERNSYGADNVLFSKTKWKRNDNGKLIEKSEYDSLGNTVSKEIREYDARGYYTGRTKYEKGKLKWKHTYQLDDRGNRIHGIEVGSLNEGSEIDTLCIFMAKYDEFDNFVEYDELKHNQLSKKYFFKYNANKVKIEERQFLENYQGGVCDCGESRSSFLFYNTKGEPSAEYGCKYYEGYTIYEGEDYFYRIGVRYWHKKYDEKGNIVEELQKEDGESDATSSSPINYEGYSEQEAQKIEKNIKNTIKDFDTKTEYVYTFDTYGNWVTRTIYKQNKNSMPTCTEIVEREIEYYETE